MPLPLIIGAAVAIAGAAGIGSAAHGAVKMKKAKDKMDDAQKANDRSMEQVKTKSDRTTEFMDALGKRELEILKNFEEFSQLVEKIQGRPEFGEIKVDDVKIPTYTGEELRNVSIGAGVLLGGLGGAAVGTAGGFAAAGATTAAVMALGTASTGTAIASLSGAALTNATLAALGGGAIAAGGGGIALGTTVLGAATLGVGLLVGGIIFSITGSSISHKADEVAVQCKKNIILSNKICNYLDTLFSEASRFRITLLRLNQSYLEHLSKMRFIITNYNKVNWKDYTDEEKLIVQNTVLLTGVLYNMCKVQLVLKTENSDDMNTVNTTDIDEAVRKGKAVLQTISD